MSSEGFSAFDKEEGADGCYPKSKSDCNSHDETSS
jgi:hypothetical protein